MNQEKDEGILQDFKSDTCGCYELGSWCYDREGEPTHLVGDECNN